jgi:hypothetical protein
VTNHTVTLHKMSETMVQSETNESVAVDRPANVTTATLKRLDEVLARAAGILGAKLHAMLPRGGFSREQYVRYLSMQYHLTKGVQKHFLAAASHPCFEGRRKFRDFLYDFAMEEEPHFRMAAKDLEALGAEPLPRPLDVALWWAYYDRMVVERPFRRLGATYVLENLGAAVGPVAKDLLVGKSRSAFLDESNTKFLVLHMHEVLPHGDQILGALRRLRLTAAEGTDLVDGAKIGATLYLRMAAWALQDDPLLAEFVPELDA